MSTKLRIGELADAVIKKIESDELEKTASVAYKNTIKHSETAELLSKIAEEVRQRAHSATEITYKDLTEYRKRHDRS